MSSVKSNVDGQPTQYLFKYLMEEVEAGLPAKEFYWNDNVHEYQFNTSTGAIVSSGGLTGYYTDDNLPDSTTSALASDPYAQAAQEAQDLAAQNAVDPTA